MRIGNERERAGSRVALATALWVALAQAGACVQTESADAPSAANERRPAASHAARKSSANAGQEMGVAPVAGDAAAVPPAPLVVMTWNLEWFADPDEGPSDDAAQYAAVRDVLRDARADVIALEEVASSAAFERLIGELPGRAAVLSGYDWTQKTALLWDESRFSLVSELALTGLDDAGRPPLEVVLRCDATGEVLVVTVIHAKAQADEGSHAVRERLSQGLKAHLDLRHAQVPAILLGDFNDSLVGSITTDAESPYRAFLDDTAHYATPTRALDAEGAPESSYAWGVTIDHIVVSDELASAVDPEGAEVLRDELLAEYPDYLTRVSDHFPVRLRIWW